jgi:hypothetical protein
MRYEEEKRRHVSFCGYYCHLCDWFTGEIKNTAKKMLELVEEYEGFTRVLKGKVDPKDLVEGLRLLSEISICSGCKAEMRERCEIVRCCGEKGFDHCDECSEFPCTILQEKPGVIKFHTIENLKEMEKVGIPEWIDRQWK